jgi:recombination protein U
MLNHSHANRGMGLEQLIDMSNQQYRIRKLAVIQKVPTPVKRTKKRLRGMEPYEFIAVYEKDSTVDYIGNYDGKPVAFEAKQCAEKTRFPLDKVQEHQVKWMKENIDLGGVSFLIIELTELKRIHRVPFEDFYEFWILAREGGRQSIPIAAFDAWNEVKSSRGIVLDYLA